MGPTARAEEMSWSGRSGVSGATTEMTLNDGAVASGISSSLSPGDGLRALWRLFERAVDEGEPVSSAVILTGLGPYEGEG